MTNAASFALPTKGYQAIPSLIPDEKQHRRMLADGVNLVQSGKQNITIDVTLAQSATITTIKDARIGYTSAIIPAMPMTANGATALINGIYVDTIMPSVAQNPGSCVVHHASNSATDQKIRFIIIG